MAPLTASIEIDRTPQDVFAYASDPVRQTEWQEGLLSVKVETDGPVGVGTKAVDTRKVPGGTREFPFELTEFDAPNRMSFQVTGGPVRPNGTMTFSPLDGGTRTKVDFSMEFKGHGFGVLLIPLVNRDARKLMPKDLAQLKARLESPS
jgi:uncharacterized protein YndB with AHSA1/START domain